jgi:hypothetical protein
VKDLPEEIAMKASDTIDIEERIIQSLHDKKFSRNAISETADDLGGLNRGTVAEYFRGHCFKAFVENKWDIGRSVQAIAGGADPMVEERLLKKFTEYIGNAVESVDRTQPLEYSLKASKPKYKNLPQRYHPFLEMILTSYHRGEWALKAYNHQQVENNSPEEM